MSERPSRAPPEVALVGHRGRQSLDIVGRSKSPRWRTGRRAARLGEPGIARRRERSLQFGPRARRDRSSGRTSGRSRHGLVAGGRRDALDQRAATPGLNWLNARRRRPRAGWAASARARSCWPRRACSTAGARRLTGTIAKRCGPSGRRCSLSRTRSSSSDPPYYTSAGRDRRDRSVPVAGRGGLRLAACARDRAQPGTLHAPPRRADPV